MTTELEIAADADSENDMCVCGKFRKNHHVGGRCYAASGDTDMFRLLRHLRGCTGCGCAFWCDCENGTACPYTCSTECAEAVEELGEK